MPPRRFIGLMSGTSLDGVDCVLAEETSGGRLGLRAGLTRPYPDELQQALAHLCREERPALERLMEIDRALASCYAEAVRQLLRDSGHAPAEIVALGSHGQTIRHRPALGSSLQIGDPACLAELTGIPVVADFRRADLAAGGQGAPLAPLFHRALLWRGEPALVVVNIGGMANVSVLRAKEDLGFDSGPGNVLLDAWAARHLGAAWDADGAFAARGRVDEALLRDLLAHPYLERPPPKSTGREDFHLQWLDEVLASHPALPPQDVQATLSAFTAETIARAVEAHSPPGAPVLVCGGGVRNADLMRRLQRRLAPRTVTDTGARGVDPHLLEALGFAWLAMQRVDGRAVDTRRITGARHPVILGGLYLPYARSARGT